MRLTGRGIALLTGSIVLFGAGEWLGHTLPRLLGFAGAGVVGLGFLLARRGAEISVMRTVYPHEVVRDGSAVVRITLRNKATRTSPRLIAEEPITHADPVHTVVHPLPPNGSVYRTYDLPTGRRGRIGVGPMTLRCEDPLGLVARVIADNTMDEYWVLPRLHDARLHRSGRRPEFVGLAANRTLRGSTDFQSLREYVIGDDLRHVHWKSLARSDRLMVRQYADPPRPDLTVLLDNRPGVLTPAAFEEAVEVAASLLMAGRLSGHRIRLRTTDGEEMTDSGDNAIVRRLCEVAQTAQPKALLGGRAGGPLALITGGDAVAELFTSITGSTASCTVIDLSGTGGRPGPSGAHIITAATAADAVAQWSMAVRG